MHATNNVHISGYVSVLVANNFILLLHSLLHNAFVDPSTVHSIAISAPQIFWLCVLVCTGYFVSV